MTNKRSVQKSSFKILVYIFSPAEKMRDSLEKRMQSATKVWWRDAEIYKKQRCTVENKMQKNGGSSVQRVLFWERTLVLEQSELGQNERLGDKRYEMLAFAFLSSSRGTSDSKSDTEIDTQSHTRNPQAKSS